MIIFSLQVLGKRNLFLSGFKNQIYYLIFFNPTIAQFAVFSVEYLSL